jgi:hypothetical protein
MVSSNTWFNTNTNINTTNNQHIKSHVPQTTASSPDLLQVIQQTPKASHHFKFSAPFQYLYLLLMLLETYQHHK